MKRKTKENTNKTVKIENKAITTTNTNQVSKNSDPFNVYLPRQRRHFDEKISGISEIKLRSNNIYTSNLYSSYCSKLKGRSTGKELMNVM